MKVILPNGTSHLLLKTHQAPLKKWYISCLAQRSSVFGASHFLPGLFFQKQLEIQSSSTLIKISLLKPLIGGFECTVGGVMTQKIKIPKQLISLKCFTQTGGSGRGSIQ